MKTAPSLYLSEKWREFGESVLGLRSIKFGWGKCNAGMFITPSRISFIKKYWLGGLWATGTGIGIHCESQEDTERFFEYVSRKIFGIYQGFSNFPIDGVSTPVETRIIDISKPQKKLLASFSKRKRNAITQGLRRGVSVKIIEEFESASKIILDIKGNYDYWKRDLKQLKLGLYHGMLNQFVKVFVAFANGRVAAVAMFLLHGNRMTYSVSGFKREFKWYQPMDVLIFEAMKWGRKNGFTEMDLLGGASKDSGIGRFKSGYGGKLETKHFFRGVKFGKLRWGT